MKIAYELDGEVITIYTSIEALVRAFNGGLLIDTNVGYLRIMEEE